MPWRGPQREGELPSLGWLLLDWWFEFLPSPRDPSDHLVFTNEQALILVEWFTIDPATGRYIFRRGQSRRAKGWGKSPVEAAKCIAELAGPVVFNGWDANGEPVGRPWGTGRLPQAWVQIAAVSEDQTENTHSVVYDLLTANDGKAADELHIDAGLTRSYLRDGDRKGKLEPVTASAGTREGQPITYGCLDETHLWVSRNGGVKLARTIRRNVGKMNGRSYETTNSFIPGEGSVAEGTYKAHEKGSEGVYVDAVEAPAIDLDVATDPELRGAMSVAYGDSWWVDLDRLVRDARDPDTPREDVERFNLNWNTKAGGRAVDMKRWMSLARAEPASTTPIEVPEVGAPPPRKTPIGIGFTGSISETCAIVRGCTPDGYSFLIGKWIKPEGADSDWRIPRAEVVDAIENAFLTWHVGRLYGDPAKWRTEIESLIEKYGDDRVEFLDTDRDAKFAPACDRWFTAIREGTHTHDLDPHTTAHVLAAHKRRAPGKADDDDGRSLYVIVRGEDNKPIHGAVSDVLAYEAALTMPDPTPRSFWGAVG